jgi:hypothetical protein
MTRGEVCLLFAAAESTSAFVQAPDVPASQCRLEANDAPPVIDPPSPYWPGWHTAREQCLGAVSLAGCIVDVYWINLGQVPPRTRPEEGWSA